MYNHLLEKLILPFGDTVEGGSFMNWLRHYRQEQWLTSEHLLTLQRNRLNRMLKHARDFVPFYANIPKLSGNCDEDLKQFPILHKPDINENTDRLVTVPKERLIPASGSGSSGIQGTVFMDKSAQASQRAMQMLWFEWSGYRAGDRILQTGMTTNRGIIKALKDQFLRTAYIPAFTLSPDALASVLRQIEKSPRDYLFGYASSLYVLAKLSLELKIETIRFKKAVSWGDKLFPHYRKTIQQAFGCETLDTYGCTEGAMIGAECAEGSFHLCVNQCHIEVVDDDGQPVPEGKMGKVLVTRLDNFAMPLIRYYLGDLVETDSAKQVNCACGRQLPQLKKIIGRDTDIVRTRSGKYLIVHFFTAIFEHIPQVKQFQVIQKNLDELEIQYIAGKDFNEDVLPEIEIKIFSALKEKFPIKWKETNYIAPTGSGKPQIIQSFLKDCRR